MWSVQELKVIDIVFFVGPQLKPVEIKILPKFRKLKSCAIQTRSFQSEKTLRDNCACSKTKLMSGQVAIRKLSDSCFCVGDIRHLLL